VAVVTGVSRGIGQAVAIRRGRLGANVVVDHSRDASGAAATVAAIEAVGRAPERAFSEACRAATSGVVGT